MTQPQPLPPMPPLPPPGAAIEVLRETVETQARIIRYLLANYEALLRKIEDEPQWTIEWDAGAAKTFAVGDPLAVGWWLVTSAAFQITLPAGVQTYNDGDFILAYGATTAATVGTAVPIAANVVWPKEAA